MKLAIIGSREFTDYKKARKIYKNFFEKFTTAIVSGGARGADLIGKQLAEEFEVEYIEYPADWNGPHGKMAGFIRNGQIVDASDMCLCFWDGASSGTKDSLDKLKASKKPTFLIYV